MLSQEIIDRLLDPNDALDYSLRSDFVRLLRTVESKLGEIFNTESGDRQLTVSNIRIDFPENLHDYGAQKEAKLKNLSYTAPIKADFTITDKTGKKLAVAPNKLIMRMPLPTGRGTFIINGKEYAIRRQLRLKPGVYTTEVEDGIQAFINTGSRQSMKVRLNTEDSKFMLQLGGRNFPLYSILRGLGIPDDAIKQAWGDGLYNKNAVRSMSSSEDTIDKLHSTLYRFGSTAESYAEKVEEVMKAFEETSLDPWTTKVTVGKSYTNVSPQLLLDSTRKMLGVSSGDIEPDRRDAVYFKNIFGIDDMVEFALNKAAPKLKSKIAFRLSDPNKDIQSILSRPLTNFDSTVTTKFNVSDLSYTPNQLNPLDMFNTINEVTLMGEGGIGDTHSIPVSTRSLDDSYIGFIDPIQTPTNNKIGVNMVLAATARKRGQELTTFVVAPGNKIKDQERKSTVELFDKYVALPEEYKYSNKGFTSRGTKVNAIYKGNIVQVPPEKIDFILPGAGWANSFTTMIIPLINHNSPERVTFATKQMAAAIPIMQSEAPYVRSLADPTRSDVKDSDINRLMHRMFSVITPSSLPKGGTVTKVENGVIHITPVGGGKSVKVNYYENFPLNSHVFLNYKPVVQVGDKVKPAQVLAASNFSAGEEFAMGRNLKIAYMPWKGMNFKDGLVISESAAQKMISEHLHQDEWSVNKGDVINKNKFISHYPSLYNRDQLSKIDDDGVIKEGVQVFEGDPLLLKLSERRLTEDDILRGRISSVFKNPFGKDDKAWDSKYVGVIDKVVKGKNFVKVFIKTVEPLDKGDKLTGMYGQKGVVTAIAPDDEMPRTADGEIMDIIQNPPAVPSRMNIGQIIETAASKIARKTGKPFYTDNYTDDTSAQSIHKQMKELGIDPESVLYDKDGNPIAGGAKIFEGYQYFMKLKQQSKKYLQYRNADDPYDIVSRRPTKGPKAGALGFYALLAHGATGLLKEMGGFKGELNDNWWRAFETGQPLPKPTTTFAFDKLIHFLTAAGMAVKNDNDGLRIMPLTDADVDNLSKGEILDPGLSIKIGDPSKGDFLKPFDNGLYDRKITGGTHGESWGHITLAEPLPNPLFENPIKALLGLTQTEYDDIVSGRKGFEGDKVVRVTSENFYDVKTGGVGLRERLAMIDRDAMLKQAKDDAVHSRGQKRNKAFSQIKYLQGLKIAGLQPQDYIITKMPVLPPAFRPVYMTRAGDLRVSDFTSLYQDLGKVNNSLKEARGLPPSVITSLRADLYDAVKGVQGVGNIENYDGGRKPSGILSFLKGDVPAWGHFQDKIFGRRASIGGRAVIMADPKLNVDEVGVPEEMAWTIFKPFIMRDLTSRGLSALQVDQMIDNRAPVASLALDRIMAERPVIISRDPKLHKFNMMAFRGKRVHSDALQIPPLICAGFNADFDGDAMSVHVPVTEEALRDAKTKMMPSQNLIKYGRDTVIMAPEEDSIAGLYAGTKMESITQKKFASFEDAIKAYENKEIKLTDGIYVNNIETTPGRILVNEKLPERFRDYSAVWGKEHMIAMLGAVAKEEPTAYVPFVERIKDLGDNFGYEKGISFRLEDFYSLDTSELNSLRGFNPMSPELKQKILEKMKKAAGNNTLALLADSGARGSWDNMQQILYSPVYASSLTGSIIPHKIKSGFAKGMDWLDYWTITKGSRLGLQTSALEVSDPGFFGKELTRSTMGMTITPGDSDTPSGIDYPVEHQTVLSRYLAKDVVSPNGSVLARAGDPVTQELVEAARKAKIATFNVRSPLTSTALKGLYAKDFGRLPDNKKLSIGTDAGIISAQTLTEPATQLVLRARHGGGAAGQQKTISGLYAIWPLLSGRAPTGAKALLAPADGVVGAVERLKSGIYKITMKDGTELLTPSALPLNIKVGQAFTRGQQLQDGYPDPKEMLEYNGLRSLQNYLVDQIESNYGSSAPDRRYIETLVSSLTKYATVEDAGDDDSFMPGDIATIPQLEDYNRKNENKIKFKPLYTGIAMFMPKIEDDWVTKMMGRDMIRQLQESASASALSRLRGPKPIMPFIYNMSFGDTIETDGNY